MRTFACLLALATAPAVFGADESPRSRTFQFSYAATIPDLPTDTPARVLYDVVNGHMKYDKPKDKPGWGRGDAVWACDNGFGNCSDFHSLFISLARAKKIPAKFEIGFLLPEKRGKENIEGYHCWAK